MPPGSSIPYWGSNIKREGIDKEEKKEGLRLGCRNWPAKRVQENGTGWQKERVSIYLGSLCVALKGGAGVFVGGDPTCLPRKGTAHCFKSRVTWEVIRKALLNPVRVVKE